MDWKRFLAIVLALCMMLSLLPSAAIAEEWQPDEDLHEHSYEQIETVEPTCTEHGYTVYSCTEGDDEYTAYTDALGHDYISDVTEASCTEPGYTVHTCVRCGDSYTDEPTEAHGHSWDEGSMSIDSRPGEGTTVTLRLPAASDTLR